MWRRILTAFGLERRQMCELNKLKSLLETNFVFYIFESCATPTSVCSLHLT